MTKDESVDRHQDPSADGNETAEREEEPVLSLPENLRRELKDPIGPIETDAQLVIESASGPIVAVGDVVTYHLRKAGSPPDVAVVDGKTKRDAVDEEIRREVTEGPTIEATNPPAVLTEEMIKALMKALEREEPTTIMVDGEEDLVTLPAIVAAPDGATIVYGQPDEGMVVVEVNEVVREKIRNLLSRFDGETDRLLDRLE